MNIILSVALAIVLFYLPLFSFAASEISAERIVFADWSRCNLEHTGDCRLVPANKHHKYGDWEGEHKNKLMHDLFTLGEYQNFQEIKKNLIRKL